MKKGIFYSILIASVFAACVPAKKVEDIKQKKEMCEEELASIKERHRKIDEEYTEAKERLESLKKQNKGLSQDTTVMGKSLRVMTKNYDKLNETYDLLLEKNRQMLQGNQRETEELFGDLKQSKSELMKQTAALEEAQRNLAEKENNLRELESELEKREAKVNELESILSRKDSTVNALKSKVQNALLGFENKGLTIEQKNGKVYVSMDESLLFASGSYNIGNKGKEALKNLGNVLANNSDVNVLVEGHTDNVPYNGSGALKDNWDLSVKRATSVVKIILENSKIEAERLTAAGKADFIPIATNDTKEGRAKNRRTEIILTPKLDELLEILETN
ncbi:MAG: OmpA family protein [Vicingaceae bacterium]